MRRVIDLCMDWKFREEDLEPRKPTDGWGGAKARAYLKGAAAIDFDDSAWRTVDVPHDFVSEKEYCFKSADSGEMRDIPEMESIGSRLFDAWRAAPRGTGRNSQSTLTLKINAYTFISAACTAPVRFT